MLFLSLIHEVFLPEFTTVLQSIRLAESNRIESKYIIMVVLNPYARLLDLTDTGDGKLFKTATTGSKTKFDLTNDPTSAESFKILMEEASNEFAWGQGVNAHPVEWNDDGEVTRTVHLLKDFRKVTIAEVVRGSGVRFGCTFDADNDDIHDFTMTDTDDNLDNIVRVKLTMIGLWLKNSLSEEGLKAINNDKDKFEYTNTDFTVATDGAALLVIILKKIMPTTKVGVSIMKTELMTMTPASFNGDITKMITKMQTLKHGIESEAGNKYDDFLLHLFRACAASSHKKFADFSQSLRDQWESDMLADDSETAIVDKLSSKWNNECRQGQQTPGAASESNDPKLLALFTALTTNVQTLSEQVKAMQTKNGGSNTNNSSKERKNQLGNIADWRKSKELGDSVFKDGKHYYWCKNHNDGKGLYVTHHPDDHGLHPSKWTHTQRSGKSDQSSESSKLQLSEKMQAALTSSGISADQAKELLKNLGDSSSTPDFW